MPKAEPLYYVKGDQVFKRTVRRRTSTGTSTRLGFLVCTASECVSASAIAVIFNENERPEIDAPDATSQQHGGSK